MRKLLAAVMVAGATLIAGQAIAADFPEYPPVIEIPEVDYGVQGSFYLRGSAAANALWTREADGFECAPGCGGLVVEETFPFAELGYGYSVGAGFGYETGTGLRTDVTVDYVSNSDLELSSPGGFGNYSASLRSTIALANVYYDFSLGGAHGYGAAGGVFGYVGAGAGAAFNEIEVDTPSGGSAPTGTNTSFAAAAMAGVGYDFGSVVTDLGYRGVYIAELSNGAAGEEAVSADNNWLHEVRGTVRYRFN